MRITELQLRSIIKEELQSLLEINDDGASATSASVSKLPEAEKNKLVKLSETAPSNLTSFSANLKALAAIIDGIDPKAAAIDTSQLKQYWTQIMTVIDSMISKEKTSTTDTAKVAKALG